MLPQALPGSPTIWTAPRGPENSVLYNAWQTGQPACSIGPAVQTIAPTQITEHPLPRWIRHASLCSLLVGGMVIMAGAGTKVRVVDQYSGEPLARFSVVDAVGSSYQ